ncbi:MAG: class I SAM-dependent methyltransferase [Patescibacteria group bacterium]
MFFKLLDTGDGERLEQFGKYILRRPDPQIIWKKTLTAEEWGKANAVFDGEWKVVDMPREWDIEVLGLTVELRLTPFKHTGIFPEQEEQWRWISQKSGGLNILNLFGYTGVASLVAAKAGAKVTHVDGSKPTITWAKLNQQRSALSDKPIRWILEDAIKFVEREVRRGNKYDGIILDPPAFGHGPEGETWQFNKSLPRLMTACKQLLSENAKFVIINAYAVSSSALTLKNLLVDMNLGGHVEYGEHVIDDKLSTGIWGRWEAIH